MAKKIFAAVALFLILSVGASAMDFSFGILYGFRGINNSKIRSIYGEGTVYFPFASVKIWKGLIIGAGYEGGYSLTGKIGLYYESSSLKVVGPEVFLSYEFDFNNFCPYLKAGFGYFSYKQTIENPYVQDYKVDHSQGALAVAGGFKIYPIKSFYMAIEIKYIPLTVKPYEEKVDLSGFRYLGGVGFRFGL
ncbi:MAG: hypothetical protein WCC06_05655 [Candidatus Aminicenantales bacterium]